MPDGKEIPGIIPASALRDRLIGMGIPDDLSGKRVLDVGAATGWNSFEMERRGARVVAIDYVEYEDFQVAKAILNSHVEYRIMEVDDLRVEEIGTFDIVLFFGVLYHLRHPLYSLERVLSVTSGTAYIESFVCDAGLADADREANSKYMEFYETTELGGQLDNWFGPSTNCLAGLCRSAGFADVEFRYVRDHRAGFKCGRMAAPLAAGRRKIDVMPTISSAVNNRHGRPEFAAGKDEYICTYFSHPMKGLGADEISLRVGQYDVPILTLTDHGEGVWQANARLPIDIPSGEVAVRASVAGSTLGAPVSIFVDCPAVDGVTAWDGPVMAPELYRATQGLTHSTLFQGDRSEYLCCCFRANLQSLARTDVQVEIGDVTVGADFAGKGDGWQVNCRIPESVPGGIWPVRIRIHGAPTSDSRTIEIRRRFSH